MKILTGKKQRQAEKLLAAILIICNKGDLKDPETYTKLIANIGDVVYLVGGEKALHKVGKTAFNFDRGGEQNGMDKLS